jgi:hypothetical protein
MIARLVLLLWQSQLLKVQAISIYHGDEMDSLSRYKSFGEPFHPQRGHKVNRETQARVIKRTVLIHCSMVPLPSCCHLESTAKRKILIPY